MHSCSIPVTQWGFRVRVLLPELSQGSQTNDSHLDILSKITLEVKFDFVITKSQFTYHNLPISLKRNPFAHSISTNHPNFHGWKPHFTKL